MSREFRLILRFMGTDIDGTKKVAYGLGKIRGVGPNLAFAVVRAAKINPEARMGALSDGELSRVEDVIKDPLKHGIPPRMVNRRKDIETGRDMHLVGADLALKIKSDIDLMKDIKSWKGVRHSLGLKVRGQRTRTTGRSGKAVGVKKKGFMEAARAAGEEEEEKEKKLTRGILWEIRENREKHTRTLVNHGGKNRSKKNSTLSADTVYETRRS